LIKTLKKEKYDLNQKYEDKSEELDDCKLDLKLLREQITRQRIGCNVDYSASTTNKNDEREILIKEIECIKEKNTTLENDFNLIVCQKEEVEIERDSYKNKLKLLNKFMIENSRFGGKEELSVNIDEIISKNKYLIETNKLLNEYCSTLLSKKKTNRKQDEGNEEQTNVLNKNGIKELLKKSNEFTLNHPETTSIELIKELNKVFETLLDNLNDKHVGLQHQRKCNKLLALRIQELELEINSFKTLTKQQDEKLIKFDDEFNLINDKSKEEEIICSNYNNSEDLLQSRKEPFILNT
jgi:dephospho-CoA kinase